MPRYRLICACEHSTLALLPDFLIDRMSDASGTLFDQEPQSLKVSEIISRIQSRLNPLNPVIVEGEISSHVCSRLKHHYFELKDASAKISCVIFNGAVRALPKLENGLLVKLTARVNIYPQRGTLQLQVHALELLGDGALQQKFERLKLKLSEEGLFDTERKRPLPAYPERIILMTSDAAAAKHDVIKTLNQHWPCLKVSFIPIRVQGVEAIADITRALRHVEKIGAAHDLLLLVRGGGSLDDLWSFNEEAVVRALARAPIPVVTGIGHETDFTLADFVADHRGPTPTGAANAICKGKAHAIKTLNQHSTNAHLYCQNLHHHHLNQLSLGLQSLRADSPINTIAQARQKIDYSQIQAKQILSAQVATHERCLQQLLHTTIQNHPSKIFDRHRTQLSHQAELAVASIRWKLREWRAEFSRSIGPLSPKQLKSSYIRQCNQLRNTLSYIQKPNLKPDLHILSQQIKRLQQSVQMAYGVGQAYVHNRTIDLRPLNPKHHIDINLKRGFALVKTEEGEIIKTGQLALRQAKLKIQFSDKTISAKPDPQELKS